MNTFLYFKNIKIYFITTLIFFNSINLYANSSHFDILFIKYGRAYNVSPILLKAIAKTESDFMIKAKNINKNGSIDYGLMQINSIHEPFLKANNLSLDDLYNPKINIQMGARILSICINRHGLNYKAINCYNGRIRNNPYSNKVISNLKQIKTKVVIK